MVTSAKMIVDDVQMKRFIRPVPVKIKDGPWKILEVAHVATQAVFDPLSGLPGPSDNVPIVENEIVEVVAFWIFSDLTCSNDRGRST